MNIAGGKLGPASVLELTGLGRVDPPTAERAFAALMTTGATMR